MECSKIKHRIACEKCGYSYSEARYPDDWDHPLLCSSSDEECLKHIVVVQKLQKDRADHPYDCKCILCR